MLDISYLALFFTILPWSVLFCRPSPRLRILLACSKLSLAGNERKKEGERAKKWGRTNSAWAEWEKKGNSTRHAIRSRDELTSEFNGLGTSLHLYSSFETIPGKVWSFTFIPRVLRTSSPWFLNDTEIKKERWRWYLRNVSLPLTRNTLLLPNCPSTTLLLDKRKNTLYLDNILNKTSFRSWKIALMFS